MNLFKWQVGSVVEILDDNVFEIEFVALPIKSNELLVLHYESETV